MLKHFFRLTRILKLVCLLVTVCIFFGLAVIFAVLWGSLAKVSGEHRVHGLQNLVVIERDKLANASVDAQNRTDACRALGFLHAQERYFQMDCLRRGSAGELSELFGELALLFDKRTRPQELRGVALKIFNHLGDKERQELLAYTDGVNCGLKALHCAPFEYWVLRAPCLPWRPEDTFLVCYNLFQALQDSQGEKTVNRGTLYAQLPKDVARFLAENGSIWEAAIDGSRTPKLPIPPATSFAYLSQSQQGAEPHCALSTALAEPIGMSGSNSWAVTSDLAKDGGALVACDMHLRLGVPNVWYRARLRYKNESGRTVCLDGATLPGVPAMIIGTNQNVSWGFTNSQINTTDLIAFELGSDGTYRLGEQTIPLEVRNVPIKVRGRPDYIQVQRHSHWGPVLDKTYQGYALAARTVERDFRALNLGLVDLEGVENVDDAIAIAKSLRIPALHFFSADTRGQIGWSLTGSIPQRTYKTYLPLKPDEIDSWQNFIPPHQMPSKIYRSNGRLWNANHRMLNEDIGIAFNTENMINGIRGFQIERALTSDSNWTPEKMLRIQLEERAIFFDRWHDLVNTLVHLPACANIPRIDELKRAVAGWDGHCRSTSVGYPCIRNFRECIMQRILKRLLAPCYSSDPEFSPSCVDFEEPIWQILAERPEYLIDPVLGSWEKELVLAIETMESTFATRFKGQPLDQLQWKDCQIVDIRHPLGSKPYLAKLLNMSTDHIGGDAWVPKIFYFSLGATQRMVVSPGRENAAHFHMPGGQSGNPLSRNFRSAHPMWLRGEFQPLVPGKSQHRLKLLP